METVEITELNGKVLVSIENKDNEELVFTTDTGEIYKLYHEQDCCESVLIEDVIGDLDDLVGVPLLMTEEVCSNEEDYEVPEYTDSCTWTFYKFATIKGYVTIRWFGQSNGYYSEEVDFVKVN